MCSFVEPRQCKWVDREDFIRRPCVPTPYEYYHPTEHRNLRLKVFRRKSNSKPSDRRRNRRLDKMTADSETFYLAPPLELPIATYLCKPDVLESARVKRLTKRAEKGLTSEQQSRKSKNFTVYSCPLCCPSCVYQPAQTWKRLDRHYDEFHWKQRQIIGDHTVFVCSNCCALVELVRRTLLASAGGIIDRSISVSVADYGRHIIAISPPASSDIICTIPPSVQGDGTSEQLEHKRKRRRRRSVQNEGALECGTVETSYSITSATKRNASCCYNKERKNWSTAPSLQSWEGFFKLSYLSGGTQRVDVDNFKVFSEEQTLELRNIQNTSESRWWSQCTESANDQHHVEGEAGGATTRVNSSANICSSPSILGQQECEPDQHRKQQPQGNCGDHSDRCKSRRSVAAHYHCPILSCHYYCSHNFELLINHYVESHGYSLADLKMIPPSYDDLADSGERDQISSTRSGGGNFVECSHRNDLTGDGANAVISPPDFLFEERIERLRTSCIIMLHESPALFDVCSTND